MTRWARFLTHIAAAVAVFASVFVATAGAATADSALRNNSFILAFVDHITADAPDGTEAVHSRQNNIKLYVSSKDHVFFSLDWFRTNGEKVGALERVSGEADKFLSCSVMREAIVCIQHYWQFGIRRFLIRPLTSQTCDFDVIYAKMKGADRIVMRDNYRFSSATVDSKTCQIQSGNVFESQP